MDRRLPPALSLALVLASTALPAQSTGFVHLRTHFPNDPPSADLGVSRTFEPGVSGPVETFTEEYAPGPHTLARVETVVGACRATATNVSFTIKAGQWTEVGVPVTLQDCSFPVAMSGAGGRYAGEGELVLSVGGLPVLPVADCHTVVGSGTIEWDNFHACQGTAPYGATVMVSILPGPISCCTDSDSFVVDTSLLEYSSALTSDTATNYPPDQSYVSDVSITLVGGSYGGHVSSSVFRVVNRGARTANQVQIDVDGDIADDNDDWGHVQTIADGFCGSGPCTVPALPAGESTTVTVRYFSLPAIPGDTTAANFPYSTPTCSTVTVTTQGNVNAGDPSRADPDLSNNTASCLHGVPVTVTLGGATPPSQTVTKGALDVPMLEFTLTPSVGQTVNSVTLAAQGSGNEQVDIQAVHLYVDLNGNGRVDPGDQLLAAGTYAGDDGSVTLDVAPPYAITAPTNLLVTYTFNLTLAERAAGGLVLVLLPFGLAPAARRRRTWIPAALALALCAACGADRSTGPGPGSSTYQAVLTGLGLSSGTLSNLSLSGATITIEK